MTLAGGAFGGGMGGDSLGRLPSNAPQRSRTFIADIFQVLVVWEEWVEWVAWVAWVVIVSLIEPLFVEHHRLTVLARGGVSRSGKSFPFQEDFMSENCHILP
jgi:hypothetical protein